MTIHGERLRCLLEQSALFTALNENEQAEVIRASILRRYRQTEYCTRQGDVWPYLVMVAKGSIHLLKTSKEGRSLIVKTLEAGEIFWGLAFFQENVEMPVTLQAAEDSILYLWAREDTQPILLKNSRILWNLCQLMSVRMEWVNVIVENLAFSPVSGRVAKFLLAYFEEVGAVAGVPVARTITLDEIAARIGTTREMVCRVLYRFSDKEIIQINRTNFVLINQDELKQLAEDY